MGDTLIQVLTIYLAIGATGVGFLFAQRRGGTFVASWMFYRIPWEVGMLLVRIAYAAFSFVFGLFRR